MKKNLTLIFFALIWSLPIWWTIDVVSQTSVEMFLARELQTNPQILAAYASQKKLSRQLNEAYPLPKKGEDTLFLSAKGVSSTLIRENGISKVLFSQNNLDPFLIASLTKVMTAFVAMEQYDLTQEITITPDILATEGNSGELKNLEVFTIRDLLYVALIESSNDAARALTEPLGHKPFIREMNTHANLLDMKTASFSNSTGLDEFGGNYASAQDLTKLAIHLKNNNSQIFDILSQQQFPLQTSDGKFHHTLVNTNQLLAYREWPTKILGGKTGWTPAAKQSLLLMVKSPDQKGYIVNVILGSDDRFGDMKKLLAWTLHSYQWTR